MKILLLILTCALLPSCGQSDCAQKLAEERQKTAKLQKLLNELQDAVINSTEPYTTTPNAR